MTRLIWKCQECSDIVVSYSHLRHDMNICECGVSGVDLEDGYGRFMGVVEELSYKIYKDGEWKKLT